MVMHKQCTVMQSLTEQRHTGKIGTSTLPTHLKQAHLAQNEAVVARGKGQGRKREGTYIYKKERGWGGTQAHGLETKKLKRAGLERPGKQGLW